MELQINAEYTNTYTPTRQTKVSLLASKQATEQL